MKGLVCEYYDNQKQGLFLCVSDVENFGVMIADENGKIVATSPYSIKIVKPSKSE